MKTQGIGFFKGSITPEQCKDTGMAMVLIFLLLTLIFMQELYLYCAIGVHVVNMAVPRVFRPVAIIWMGLAHLLGTIVSRIILSVVFLVVVTPVGLLRSLLGKDSLMLKGFKADGESVMQERHHKFIAEDIERPY